MPVLDGVRRIVNDPAVGDTASALKGVVYSHMASLDDSMRVSYTAFFNHTFLPDFVLGWRGFANDASRDVYLRFDFAEQVLQFKDEPLRQRSALVVCLFDGADDGQLSSELDAIATHHNTTLFMTPGAIDLLESAPPERAKLVGKATWLGGKGVFDASVARRVLTLLDDCYAAVGDLDSRLAQEKAEALLEVFTDRGSRVLAQAINRVWVEAGGDASAAPIAVVTAAPEPFAEASDGEMVWRSDLPWIEDSPSPTIVVDDEFAENLRLLLADVEA